MTQHVTTEREEGRQTAIKQVKKKKKRGQIVECGMAVMCEVGEADLILVEGHWVLSGSPSHLQKLSTIFCAPRLR